MHLLYAFLRKVNSCTFFTVYPHPFVSNIRRTHHHIDIAFAVLADDRFYIGHSFYLLSWKLSPFNYNITAIDFYISYFIIPIYFSLEKC